MSSESEGFSDIKEIHSEEEGDVSIKQRKHTLEIAKRSDSMNDDMRDKQASNALLKALNRRKAQNILNLNAATNKIPDIEPEVHHEVLGLSEDQIDYKDRTSCLFRYNETWRKNWDLFIMGLAIWNCIVIPIEVAFKPEVLDFPLFIVIDAFIDLCFAVDIIINFRTSYVNPYTGEEVLYL